MSFVPNFTTSHVIEEIVSRLNKRVSVFEQILKDRELMRDDDTFGAIHRGLRKRIAKFPAIRVISNSIDSVDYATRTIKETHNFFIDCMIKIITAHEPFVPEEACMVLGRSVQAYLNDFSERQFIIHGVRKKINIQVGNSFASSIELGYSESGSLRIARINYWIELFPTYQQ